MKTRPLIIKGNKRRFLEILLGMRNVTGVFVESWHTQFKRKILFCFQYSGASVAQSSVFQLLDAALGVSHQKDTGIKWLHIRTNIL